MDGQERGADNRAAEEVPPGRVGELLHRITDDVKVIAQDEVELARAELQESLRAAAADISALVLSGIVALIGLGLLCVAAVAALEPLIGALWLRLVIMAGVYMLIGGVVAASFAKRLKRDLQPDLSKTQRQAKLTVSAVRQELHH